MAGKGTDMLAFGCEGEWLRGSVDLPPSSFYRGPQSSRARGFLLSGGAFCFNKLTVLFQQIDIEEPRSPAVIGS